MTSDSKLNLAGWLSRPWVWLVAALAIASFFIYLFTPLSGDDYGYCGIFSGAAPRYGYIWFPRFAAFHWLYINGRLLDKFMPLVTNLPPWCLASICALMLGAMYFLAVRASGATRGWGPFALIAAIALLLPWWDSAFVFSVQVNYVWSSVFVLLAFILISDARRVRRGWRGFGLLLLCFIGGMSHEGAAVPLLGGWILYFFFSRRLPNPAQARMLIAFACGLLATLASPAFWDRVGGDHVPNDTPLILLLKSEPLVLLLWTAVIICFMIPATRARARDLLSGRFGPLVYAGLIGTPVIIASGTVGRSGWFVSLYAMIAIVGCLASFVRGRSLLLGGCLSIALIAQAAGEACIQRGLYAEYRQFEEAFLQSPDGVVYGDFTKDDDLPVWTLNRLRGVPDADDIFILESISDYYRLDSIPPVVIGSDDKIVSNLPEDVRKLKSSWPGWHEAWLWSDGNDEWILTPARGGYVLTRRVLDPGDR